MSFKSFRSRKIITEAIHDQQRLVWPHLFVEDMIALMRFSPSWSPEMEKAEARIGLTGEQADEVRTWLGQAAPNSLGRHIKIEQADGQAASDVPAITIEMDDAAADAFMVACQRLKLDKAVSRKKNGDVNEMTIAGTDEQQRKAFLVFVRLQTDEARLGVLNLAKNVEEALARMKQLPKGEEKAKAQAEMKAAGAELSQLINRIAAGELSDRDENYLEEQRKQAALVAQDALHVYRISGYFHGVYLAFLYAKALAAEDPGYTVPSVDGPKAFGVPAFNSQLPGRPMDEDFLDAVKLTGDFDEMTRWLVKACDEEIQRASPEAKQALQKNIEFEENRLRGDLPDEERAKSQETLARLRQEADRPTFGDAEALAEELRRSHLTFFARYYDSCLQKGKAEIRQMQSRIADVKRLKKALEEKEMQLSQAEGEEADEIRQHVMRLRDMIQHAAKALPHDADGNITYDAAARMAALPPDITSYRSFRDLQEAVQRNFDEKFGAENAEDEPEAPSQPQYGTPCAERRKKLFAAAERRGASVYRCRDWMVACLTERTHAQPFGRLRPKVDQNGRIIDECNLEDWEGITPQNKRLRDAQRTPCIQDGLHRFQREGVPTCKETKWCTSGYQYDDNKWSNIVNRSDHFNSYTYNGGIVAFMDCSTGYLYQYGSGTLLDEDDKAGGLLSDAKNLNALFTKCPTLRKAFERAGAMRYVKPGDVPVSPRQAMSEILGSGRLTDSGAVLIRSSGDMYNTKPVLGFVDELIIDCQDPFTNFKRSSQDISLPTVNLQLRASAANMFNGLRIKNDVLRLKNTGGVKDMTGMFQNAKFTGDSAEIAGLDTGSATSMNSAFDGLRHAHHVGVRIPDIDVSSCSSLDYAFRNSGIVSITLKGDRRRVSSALNMIQGCFMLEKIPDLRFPRLNAKRLLAPSQRGNGQTYNDQIYDIFTGCPRIQKNYRSRPSKAGNGDLLEDEIQKLVEYYVTDAGRYKDQFDQRGYFIVASPADVETYVQNVQGRRGVKGIVLDKSANTYRLFNGITIGIPSLDLNGHAKCSELFYCSILQELGEVIGGENVTEAECMFVSTSCRIYPDISFPRCRKMTVLKKAYVPNDIPYVRYSDDFEEIPGAELEVVANPDALTADLKSNILQYLLGYDWHSWAAEHDTDRLVEGMYLNPLLARSERRRANMRRDERGYLVVDDTWDRAMAALALGGEAKGLVFSDEFVEKCNKGECVPEMFQSLRCQRFPVLDLNGAKCCDLMFSGARIGLLAGFENFDKVESAKQMFLHATIGGQIPKLDTSGLKNAERMFSASEVGGFAAPLDMSHVQNCANMFLTCAVHGNPPWAGDAIDLPAATEAQGMFSQLDVDGQALRISAINLPACSNAKGFMANCNSIAAIRRVKAPQAADCSQMFQAMHRLAEVGSVDAPAAADCSQMFYSCPSLARVGSVDARAASSVENMFGSCGGLLGVCQVRVRRDVRHFGMFANTELGRRVYGENGDALLARMALGIGA